MIAFLSGFAVAVMLFTFRLGLPEGAGRNISAGGDFPGVLQVVQSDLNAGIAGRKEILAFIGVQVSS